MISKNAVVKNVFTGKKMKYEAVVIGVSTGGLNALSAIIPLLPKNYPLSVIIVQHRIHDSNNFLVEYLNNLCDIHVKEVTSRETIKPGCVYISPSGYHLLVERDKTFSLSVDPPVSFAIPSIDVLFESASLAYKDKLIGVVLTGANSDGSKGIKAIKDTGGLTIVQDPEKAEASAMPRAATTITDIDQIMPLEKIGIFLKKVNIEGGE
jgi:two-component system, chemotaxis family, protein-glutamate methylesterase/glutaminase